MHGGISTQGQSSPPPSPAHHPSTPPNPLSPSTLPPPQEGDLVEEDSDEEAPIYNPLKLPLGWDGKPIPFWLYRLHGLNIEFKCEICGGASYWGRRAFERHFKEPQHQRGLKTLGVPWSREFYEITSIADALALWKSMRERQRSGAAPGTEEEFEDDAGNVYNKKTWEDLRRQGLV